MKKITVIGTGLMLVALGLTGCQKDVNPNNDSTVKTQKLTIISSVAEVETRTTMEGDKAAGFNTAWHVGDKLGVYSYHAEAAPAALTNNAEFGIASVSDGAASFTGDINYDSADRTYDIYAYYPRSAANGSASAHTSVAATIANAQVMSANGTHDSANDYMVALPGQQVAVTGGQIHAATLDQLQFRYLVGFMNLSVREITADGIASTDVVKSVKITAEAAGGNPVIAGDFNLDLTDGAMAFTTPYNEVTVSCPEGVTLANLDAWAVVNPFTLTAADNLTFLITTDTHTIAKELPLTGELNIASGSIKTFSMGIDNTCTITPLGGEEPQSRTILSETFDACTGTQAPTSGTTLDTSKYDGGAMPTSLATAGWTAGNWQSGLGCVRLSAASATGRWITTPALTEVGAASVDVVLTFKAYNGGTSNININVTATNAGAVTGSPVSLPAGVASGAVIPAGTGIESCSYAVTIAGVTNTTQITIDSKATPSARFYLDDILVVTKVE